MFRKTNLEILLGNDKNKGKCHLIQRSTEQNLKKFHHNKLCLLIPKQFLEGTKEKI